MVYRGEKSKLGSMIFVVINREAIDMLKNKEASTFAEVEANKTLEKKIDNNIIHGNEEKYTTNLIENEENISSECEDDDIEAKNKKLMEQEKQFIPSFDIRWN